MSVLTCSNKIYIVYSSICSDGTCIHIHYTCDGIVDCKDESDEDSCSDLFLSELMGNQSVYDSSSDCLFVGIPDVSYRCIELYGGKRSVIDRNHYNQYDVKPTAEHADCPTNYSLCDFHLTECFQSDQICMFERTLYGDPAHCKGTNHLKYCKHHECPDSYKCEESYCIALHMVCDGVNDCPDSEDELFCDKLNTRGLLHCRGDDIYVHPRHVCDDVLHCMTSYDDEIICETFHCPEGCYCRGYGVFCYSVIMLHLNLPTELRSLIIGQIVKFDVNNMLWRTTHTKLNLLHIFDYFITMQYKQLSASLFNSVPNLKVLLLQNISEGHLTLSNSPFTSLQFVSEFNIQRNNLPVIHGYSFRGLKQVLFLDLHEMGIKLMNPPAFMGLENLITLNISKNLISTLPARVFQGTGKLSILVLRHNPITAIDLSSLNSGSMKSVLTTDINICCYLSLSQSCYSVRSIKNCNYYLINNRYVVVAYYLMVLYLIFCITAAVIQHRTLAINAQVPLLITYLIHDVAMLLVSLLLIVMHNVHSHNYALLRHQTKRRADCLIHAMLFVWVQLPLNLVLLALTCVHYRVTVHAITKPPYTVKQSIYFIGLFILFDTVVAILWAFGSSSLSTFLCIPFNPIAVYLGVSYLNLFLIIFVIFFNSAIFLCVLYLVMIIFKTIASGERRLTEFNVTRKLKSSTMLFKRFLMLLTLHGLRHLLQCVLLLSPFLVNMTEDFFGLLFLMSCFCSSTIHFHLHNRMSISLTIRKTVQIVRNEAVRKETQEHVMKKILAIKNLQNAVRKHKK